MILLFGGTSDTAEIALTLANAAYRVSVSTATDASLDIGEHPAISRRCGRMDLPQMHALLVTEKIRAVVDASHPYASALHSTASTAAKQAGIPYLRYDRPGTAPAAPSTRDHAEAAKLACTAGKPVLLTTGSRHLDFYVHECRKESIPLIVRVLNHPDSLEACRVAGLKPEQIVTGRGPFSLEENRALIRRYKIGVLVTKDSGKAGGVEEKLEAARLEHCQVVVVGRPSEAPGYPSSAALLDALNNCLAAIPVLALDLESVLVPEIWHRVAQVTGLDELSLTTRDIPDYAKLMTRRMAICRQHNITLPKIQTMIADLAPLDGAREFLEAARTVADLLVISDSFMELAAPLLAKLGHPTLLCNKLETDDDGFISGWVWREGGKRAVIDHLRQCGRRVLAAGDSFNDLPMLDAADSGFLFRPAERIASLGSPHKTVRDYAQLWTACFGGPFPAPYTPTQET